MLEAKKNILFEKFFSVYNKNLLKRRFNSFRVSGLECMIKYDFTFPLIIYCNHSSWWDGLVAFQISYKAGLNSFVMMEEKNLKRFFLFRKLGAFSVNREKPREALKSLNYAADLLRLQTDSVIWIFPQGEIISNDSRPIHFYTGLTNLLKKIGQCSVISLSIRYEFLGNYKPDIFVKIGQPEIIQFEKEFDTKIMTRIFAKKMEIRLDELKYDIISNELQYYQSII